MLRIYLVYDGVYIGGPIYPGQDYYFHDCWDDFGGGDLLYTLLIGPYSYTTHCTQNKHLFFSDLKCSPDRKHQSDCVPSTGQ